MSNIVPLRSGAVPAAFQNANLPDLNAAAQAGVRPSFASISIKGKTWKIKSRGDVIALTDASGRQALGTLPVVIVGISPTITKTYYIEAWTEGDEGRRPDCYSDDGIVPNADSPAIQNSACATCQWNQYNSARDGRKGKACQDNRTLAIMLRELPESNHRRDVLTEPMLLRVPPTSLGNLARYGQELSRFGAQPYMIATALSFDMNATHPVVTFQPQGWLDDAAASVVVEVMSDPLVDTIVNAGGGYVADVPAAESALARGGPAPAFAPVSGGSAPVAVPDTGPGGGAAVRAAAAAGAAATEDEEEVALRAQLEALQARRQASTNVATAPRAPKAVKPVAPAPAPAPVPAPATTVGEASQASEVSEVKGEATMPGGNLVQAPASLESQIDSILNLP